MTRLRSMDACKESHGKTFKQRRNIILDHSGGSEECEPVRQKWDKRYLWKVAARCEEDGTRTLIM